MEQVFWGFKKHDCDDGYRLTLELTPNDEDFYQVIYDHQGSPTRVTFPNGEFMFFDGDVLDPSMFVEEIDEDLTEWAWSNGSKYYELAFSALNVSYQPVTRDCLAMNRHVNYVD